MSKRAYLYGFLQGHDEAATSPQRLVENTVARPPRHSLSQPRPQGNKSVQDTRRSPTHRRDLPPESPLRHVPLL
jgi:hypothetical protein